MAPAKFREYVRYARSVDPTPLARHGRDIEEVREAIRRPLNATPRRAQDWR